MHSLIIFIRKEFKHILRDKRTMLILLVMPVVMIILFGFAVTNEVKNSRAAVLDYSKDDATRIICQHIDQSKYFDIVESATDISTIHQLFQQNKIDIAIVFSPDFESEMIHSQSAQVQLLADGTEPNQASVRTGYAQSIIAGCMTDLSERLGAKRPVQIVPVVKMLYNPQSRSEYNFVPGVIGLILMLICAMMTSIAIVREKEMGTMEVLLVSPLPQITIIMAKLVPYFIISCINFATVLTISKLVIGIPIAGSLVGFIAITLLFILVALLLGLFISTVVNSQLAAMLLSLLLIVPTVYLAGITFPIESMPAPLQVVSTIIPARWYVEVARKLMIQGVEMKYVVHETLVLGIMAIVLLLVSWKKSKTRL